MTRTMIAFACALMLAGCNQTGARADAVSADPTSDFNVTYLFEVDGCKVYRFYDNGSWARYLTTCPGSVSRTIRTGKNSTRQDNVQTVQARQ